METLMHQAGPPKPSTRQRPRCPGILAAAVLAILLAPAQALAWWSHDWSYRKQVTIDGGAKGADLKADLANVPVLIRLHEGVFKFSDANPDGSDLRFIADDDKTPLKYHIEKYDAVFNLALVWLQLPRIRAGVPTQVWMYYGNPKAAAGDSARETYDTDQVLVYHFAERGTPVKDATGYANNSPSIVPVAEDGIVGNAAQFDGDNRVELPASGSLANEARSAMTWSAWIKPAAADQDCVVYVRRDGANAFIIGLAKGAPYVAVASDAGTQRTAPTQPLGNNTWHHLAGVSGDGASPATTLYVDGEAVATAAVSLPALRAGATLGGDAVTAAAGTRGFVGQIDELQIAKVARDAAYVQLAAVNEGPSDKLVQFGADQRLSSWSSGYVGIILRSVTLDGWVVIGILMGMALLSWGVMYLKIGTVGVVGRANKAFLKLFRTVGEDFSALNQLLAGTGLNPGTDLPEDQRLLLLRAPLFRIFTAGLEGLRRRLKDERGHDRVTGHLSTQSLEAIRATLDASLVEENEELNKRMVVLTVAISGGPFLGLLGTVVGVMITFASIAASGDVNINAIAPGIAAALVATVAGLVVAIPALFGYNYLTTRINAIAAQMQVFVDACVTRMAEDYNAPLAPLGKE